uniref:Uncharacterized protein n=1 Tax=Ananas comosus var. bracteatus TaxID=296719 RepID=A0A6V7PSF7_ANACO|nr:unnamed protein product [Ananas comosus var. bracteatus]
MESIHNSTIRGSTFFPSKASGSNSLKIIRVVNARSLTATTFGVLEVGLPDPDGNTSVANPGRTRRAKTGAIANRSTDSWPHHSHERGQPIAKFAFSARLNRSGTSLVPSRADLNEDRLRGTIVDLLNRNNTVGLDPQGLSSSTLVTPSTQSRNEPFFLRTNNTGLPTAIRSADKPLVEEVVQLIPQFLNSAGAIRYGAFEIGVVPGIKSITNSISRSGSIPGSSVGNTSGNSRTTDKSSNFGTTRSTSTTVAKNAAQPPLTIFLALVADTVATKQELRQACSGECRDKPESRWRQIDVKRTPWDARAAFSEAICKIADFPAGCTGTASEVYRSIGLQRDLARWIRDFERNPRSPYLRFLVKLGVSSIARIGRFQSTQQVVSQLRGVFRCLGLACEVGYIGFTAKFLLVDISTEIRCILDWVAPTSATPESGFVLSRWCRSCQLDLLSTDQIVWIELDSRNGAGTGVFTVPGTEPQVPAAAPPVDQDRGKGVAS